MKSKVIQNHQGEAKVKIFIVIYHQFFPFLLMPVPAKSETKSKRIFRNWNANELPSSLSIYVCDTINKQAFSEWPVIVQKHVINSQQKQEIDDKKDLKKTYRSCNCYRPISDARSSKISTEKHLRHKLRIEDNDIDDLLTT